MPARISKTTLNAEWREKIKTSQLLNRLQAFALHEDDPRNGKPVKLSALEIRAIEILLKKTLPDLQAVAISGDPSDTQGIMFQVVHTVKAE